MKKSSETIKAVQNEIVCGESKKHRVIITEYLREFGSGRVFSSWNPASNSIYFRVSAGSVHIIVFFFTSGVSEVQC